MSRDDSGPDGRVLLREATAADAGPLTRLFLDSRAASMPYLPKVHSDEDTLAWMTHVVLPGTTVRIAETGTGELLGFASSTEPSWNTCTCAPTFGAGASARCSWPRRAGSRPVSSRCTSSSEIRTPGPSTSGTGSPPSSSTTAAATRSGYRTSGTGGRPIARDPRETLISTVCGG